METLQDEFSDISENLKVVRERVAEAAIKSGRKPEDIKLMAVTKTVSPERINFAISQGIDLIGENRVQELLKKKPSLNIGMEGIHLIGHLQTNKVKQVLPEVSMIQSVDSLHLAKALSEEAKLLNRTLEILLEVNIGCEYSKTGFPPEELADAAAEISDNKNLKIRGIMAIPPICDDSLKKIAIFRKLNDLFIDIRSKKIDNSSIDILSAGMSDDYCEAVLEGSNLVRIGSAIFGRRA